MWCASIKSNYDCFLVAFPDFSSLTLLYSTDFLNSLTWRDRWVPTLPVTWRDGWGPTLPLTWRDGWISTLSVTLRDGWGPTLIVTWREGWGPFLPSLAVTVQKKKGLTVLHHIQVILIHKAMPNLILIWFIQNRGILSNGNLLLC